MKTSLDKRCTQTPGSLTETFWWSQMSFSIRREYVCEQVVLSLPWVHIYLLSSDQEIHLWSLKRFSSMCLCVHFVQRSLHSFGKSFLFFSPIFCVIHNLILSFPCRIFIIHFSVYEHIWHDFWRESVLLYNYDYFDYPVNFHISDPGEFYSLESQLEGDPSEEAITGTMDTKTILFIGLAIAAAILAISVAFQFSTLTKGREWCKFLLTAHINISGI